MTELTPDEALGKLRARILALRFEGRTVIGITCTSPSSWRDTMYGAPRPETFAGVPVRGRKWKAEPGVYIHSRSRDTGEELFHVELFHPNMMVPA